MSKVYQITVYDEDNIKLLESKKSGKSRYLEDLITKERHNQMSFTFEEFIQLLNAHTNNIIQVVDKNIRAMGFTPSSVYNKDEVTDEVRNSIKTNKKVFENF